MNIDGFDLTQIDFRNLCREAWKDTKCTLMVLKRKMRDNFVFVTEAEKKQN